MKKRAQIAVEYIIIITIAMSIVIAGTYFFRSYLFESNDRILESKLADVSSQIMVKARKMYYYGAPSKSVTSVNMPSQVDQMFIASFLDNDPAKDEYYIGYLIRTSNGVREITFQSDIPIMVATPTDCSAIPEICEQHPANKQVDCKCFEERYYSRGEKNFITEAQDTCAYIRQRPSCVTIELS